jgi:alpha-tubulin suppressor-like RCC1 family protein
MFLLYMKLLKTGSNFKNILFIDETVIDYQVFVDSTNESTLPIVYSYDSLQSDVLELISGNFTSIDRIGFVFVSRGPMSQPFLESDTFFREGSIYNPNVDFLLDLIRRFSVKNIDYLACNTLNYPDWKAYYDFLNAQTSVIIGASNDRTGNIKYGGDWMMESTGEDIELVYFSQNIAYYRYLLDQASHSMVLTNDGNVYGCGYNNYGQLGIEIFNAMINTTGKTPVSISCGYIHTMVLMDDGSIYGCGYNGNGQLGNGSTNTTQTTLTLMTNTTEKTPVSISCGIFHTIVLMDDGSIYGCGYNDSGQLGNGNTTQQKTLTAMTNTTGKTPVSISCGYYHTIVLMDDGSIYGCGYNGNGQLGNGTSTNTSTLTAMTNTTEKTPVSISCGVFHTIVLMDDGSIYGCGQNIYGQLGNGNTTQQKTLTAMTNTTGKTPVSISCGGYYTIVLMDDGSIYGCGWNYNGQLGNGSTTTTSTLTAMTNTTGKTPVSISCGGYHTIVFMDDGSIYGCGDNQYGQLGDGTTNTQTTLTAITNIPGTPVSISCGGYYIIVFMDDGSIYGCGDNQYGQLGDGTTTKKTTLTAMTNTTGKTPVSISCGTNHTMVLMDDGSIYGCGYNTYGRLGNGTNTNTSTLTAMTNTTGKTPVSISCGNSHTIVLMDDGSIYGCGYNGNGQLGNGSTTNTSTLTSMTNTTGKTPVSISCGGYYTMVLMSDGSIYGCGYNGSGQLGNGSTTTTSTLTAMTNTTGKTPVSVSCGEYHTMVLMDDGSIYGCGLNYYGVLGNGSTTDTSTLTAMTNTTGKTPLSISCGAFHTIVLMDDGSIYGCGYNDSGQLGNGTTTNTSTLTSMTNTTGKTPVSISCGYDHTLVLMSDGYVYGCGQNGSGQLGDGSTTSSSSLIQMTVGDGITPISEVSRLMDSEYILSYSTICFPGNTPILTDQGRIPISAINPKKHKIGGENIVAITRTISVDNYLVCFERHSLGPGVPSEKTIMSKDHCVVYNKYLLPAKQFLVGFRGVYKIKYNQEILYNVLMSTYQKINVNNLICETLHPENPIAKLYNNPKSESEKRRFVFQMNHAFKKGNQKKLKQLVCKL